jgi:hypothetical protein
MARDESTLPGGARISDLVALGALAEYVPDADLRAALSQAGVKPGRNRLLPADMTALYVIALSLYRSVSYEEVLRCLLEGFKWLGLPNVQVATKGAITQARERLGKEALRLLFERLARPMATAQTHGAWYRSWLTVAFDGTTLALPDTTENAAKFGYPAAASPAGYPLLRTVCLCETGTHAAFAATLAPYASSEREMAMPLLTKLKPGMLLLADRGFLGYDFWEAASLTGADLLWRASKSWELPKTQRLADGSWISTLHPNKDLRRNDQITVRVIQYAVEGVDEIYRLVTTILDPAKAPALELAALYHERWEVELIFDEIKTHLKGARLTLRSKTPDLVEQEFWGLILAHRMLRSLIHQAALNRKLDPDEVSFTHAIRVVRRTLPRRTALSP